MRKSLVSINKKNPFIIVERKRIRDSRDQFFACQVRLGGAVPGRGWGLAIRLLPGLPEEVAQPAAGVAQIAIS